MGKKPSEQKRAAILDAATRAFRDEGYETTSMDRIAEAAGVSKRTVYNHFQSKEALFQAVVERLIDKMMASKRIEWDPSRPLEDQLADMARTKSTVADNPAELGLIRVAISVFVSHPELAESCIKFEDDPLVPWLEAAHEAGRLKVSNVPLAAKVFWAMASGALFWPTLLEGPMPDEERKKIVREIVKTFLSRHRA
jgi:TetR/AcrR family transcriptional regulator of autoinduction and epiphytic fitness